MGELWGRRIKVKSQHSILCHLYFPSSLYISVLLQPPCYTLLQLTPVLSYSCFCFLGIKRFSIREALKMWFTSRITNGCKCEAVTQLSHFNSQNNGAATSFYVFGILRNEATKFLFCQLFKRLKTPFTRCQSGRELFLTFVRHRGLSAFNFFGFRVFLRWSFVFLSSQ